MKLLNSVAPEAQPESIPYETRDYVSLVVNSFRFSRGSAPLQESILDYIAVEFGDRIDKESAMQALPTIQRTAHSIASSPNGHVKGVSKDAADREARIYTERLSDSAPDTINELSIKRARLSKPDLLTTNMINKERHWAVRDQTDPYYANLKPFASNIVKHGLIGESTGRPEYDAMFRFAVQPITADSGYLNRMGWLNVRHDAQLLSYLNVVLRKHLSNRPQDLGPLQDAVAGTPSTRRLVSRIATETRDKSTV